MMRPLRSLRVRLLLAHLFVIAVGALTLSLAATAASPSILEGHMAGMRGQHPMSPQAGAMVGNLDAALTQVFRDSLNQALLVAGLAALGAALAISLVAARQVAGPVQRLALAARRIADGKYQERVPPSSTAELDALARSFNQMAATLEDSEQRRLRLIGDVAHELRTPIATLDGYLEGLADGVVESDEDVWTLLRGETGRLQRLVEDMQQLSRAETGQLSLDLAAVPPAAVVETTVARLAPDFAAKGLELQVNVPPELPPVWADPDRAIQVLTNLLANALRYTAAPGRVEVGAAREQDAVRFVVQDTGIGLDPGHLPLVFERFYRVDPSRSRALGGSGVGLSIARALVEAMGGQIWASSPGEGQGATFSFRLPVASRVLPDPRVPEVSRHSP